MSNISESFYEYKGYDIRIRFVKGNGCSYTIIKSKIHLRKQNWSHMDSAGLLLKKAQNYIDLFPDRLENKFIKVQQN